MTTLTPKRVILESPFAGDIERNVAYARQAVRHSVLLGEAPIASHLLFTQEGILDDNDPEQRKLGIAAGLAWLSQAEAMVLYIDYGISRGMQAAIAMASRKKIPVHYRTILSSAP